MSVRCLVVRGDSTERETPNAYERVVDALAGRADVESDHIDATDVASEIDAGEAVFAVGAAAVEALAAVETDCPIVPVDVGIGRYDVDAGDVDRVVDALLEDAFTTVSHPVLAVAVDGERVGHAVADVTLMTSAPARISEYGIETSDGWTETVRSDGVVVATPLGSTGYARAAGGPTLAPETGLAAVPISPYAMNPDVWVLRAPVTLSVKRDEADVSLHLDDDIARSVPANAPVDVTLDRTLSLVSVQK